MSVKWGALGEVLVVGLGVTIVVVVLFALGANALAARAEALESGPDGQPSGRTATPATALATLCFGACALVVAYGIYLIVA